MNDSYETLIERMDGVIKAQDNLIIAQTILIELLLKEHGKTNSMSQLATSAKELLDKLLKSRGFKC